MQANYYSKSTNTSSSMNAANSLFYVGKPDENNLINANFSYTLQYDSYIMIGRRKGYFRF